jgi:hypothetical protein
MSNSILYQISRPTNQSIIILRVNKIVDVLTSAQLVTRNRTVFHVGQRIVSPSDLHEIGWKSDRESDTKKYVRTAPYPVLLMRTFVC